MQKERGGFKQERQGLLNDIGAGFFLDRGLRTTEK
jgi:hypothetical protein